MPRVLPEGMRLSNVTEDDYEEWLKCMLATFGLVTDDEIVLDFLRDTYSSDRSIGVTTENTYVGTACAIDLDLVLPGGAMVDMAGITVVTVDPTVTRQGVLTCMMHHLHRRAHQEGKAIAGLVPTEWPIYGRFGYGPATWHDSLTIKIQGLRWTDNAPCGDGRPQRIAGKEARELAHSLHRRQASSTVGDVLRPIGFWDRIAVGSSGSALDALLGLASGSGGASRCVAVGDQGLAMYRFSPSWSAHGVPNGALLISDFITVDHDAAKTLWQHLFTADLITEVRLARVPVDDPLKWWISNPRQLQALRHDGLWLRPLDVNRLLAARKWAGNGSLTLRVHDSEGYADGTYQLDVVAGTASCMRSRTKADIEMDVSALGAILLGGTSATNLWCSGRIQSSDWRSVGLWDRMAIPRNAPFLSYTF